MPLSPKHPLAPQLGVGSKVGLVGKECLGFALTRLLHQGRVLRHEGLPDLIRLEHLGRLKAKPAVQPVQTTATAQADAAPFPDKPVHHPPVPIGHFNTRRPWQLLHRPCQRRLLRLAEGGGEPPAARISASGPAPKAAGPTGLWCGGPARALSRGDAGQPCASSQTAASVPTPLAARIIRRLWLLGTHLPLSQDADTISLTPIRQPLHNLRPELIPATSQIYPMCLHISPWLWFSITTTVDLKGLLEPLPRYGSPGATASPPIVLQPTISANQPPNLMKRRYNTSLSEE